eukprot:GHVS01079628.1.p1 GENE.GHVS01079628.1~~GHVS01079628.1.p1  ORF type:complete len:182 (-),score=32.73 GHVS01079628.1:215-760(-)
MVGDGGETAERKEEVQVVDISKLNLQQLMGLRQQLEQDYVSSTDERTTLGSGVNEYRKSIEGIVELGESTDGDAMLVPLTQSVYVDGIVKKPGSVLVDVGGGYFVEKPTKDAKAYCTKRRNLLNSRLNEIDSSLSQLRKRILMVRNQQEVLFRQSRGAPAGAGSAGFPTTSPSPPAALASS